MTAKTKQLRQEKPEKYAQIIEAATREFSSKGFEQGNVNTIAEDLGIGKGTLYNYIESKEALFLETIRWSAAKLTAFVKEEIRAHDDPLEKLRAFILADFRFMDENPHSYQLIASVFYGANVIYGKDSRFAEAVQEAYWEFLELLGEIISSVIRESGAKVGDLDAKIFMVFGLIESLLLYSVVRKISQPDRKKDADRVVRLLLEGICA
ncbi:MAG: TetR/AcrR family transcriptional regulator [Candidatus Abyssobacteria bacterium SURF_5]|uniref:TetR/AcrR family transcriptional regulator n=1 Tax=Abyssobacteria bacterium (strain SURF_5) TaxID=2093360 RepID=A0A3A4NJK3_ABYX5|nr:MAG: TetR/AcrR family transcriptional regulator [Candidatus Abyssubacteria bacterium SURF_5]